jgi:arabinofuranosyltransferase
MVWRVAWISEDAFITLRYVSNTLQGYGAVFNPGEAVQGYTHPLWFLLLVAGGLLASDLIYLAIGMGLFFTAATQLTHGRILSSVDGAGAHASLLALIFAGLCVSSPSWLSFQTSGLENPLSHLIIVALVGELSLRDLERPFVVTGLGALLVLTRPDFAIFFLPVSLCLLPQLRNPAALRSITLGSLPLIAWLVFATAYYGDIVPNTAYAKVGILPSWQDAVAQGWIYLHDWLAHEPIPAMASASLLLFATLRARTLATRALAAGIWLQLGYVIWVGGDFMRGRFLLSIFVASLAFGTLSLARWLAERRAPAGWSAALLLGLAVLSFLPFLRPKPEEGRRLHVPPSGIVDERIFYPGYRLDSYREHGRIVNPYLNLGLADQLRAYAEKCGGLTVHVRNPGTLGYLAGPGVAIIDGLGLTDATIAHLPRQSLVYERPRVGHPDKWVPVSYLAGRQDIAFLRGWKAAVKAGDCDFRRHTEAYLYSDEVWKSRTLFPVIDGDGGGAAPAP